MDELATQAQACQVGGGEEGNGDRGRGGRHMERGGTVSWKEEREGEGRGGVIYGGDDSERESWGSCLEDRPFLSSSPVP